MPPFTPRECVPHACSGRFIFTNPPSPNLHIIPAAIAHASSYIPTQHLHKFMHAPLPRLSKVSEYGNPSVPFARGDVSMIEISDSTTTIASEATVVPMKEVPRLRWVQHVLPLGFA